MELDLGGAEKEIGLNTIKLHDMKFSKNNIYVCAKQKQTKAMQLGGGNKTPVPCAY